MSTTPRVALVTGSTSGIGAEIARTLHARGYAVAVTGRSAERGRALIRELDAVTVGRATFHRVDLQEEGAAEEVVRATVERLGALDVVVNNAAVDHVRDLLEVSSDDVRSTFETNTVASIAVMVAAGNAMRAAGGGAIVNVISRLAAIGVPGMGVYSASKGALAAITRTAAVEWAPYGIRVNSVAPGVTRTALFEEWMAEYDDPAAQEQVLAGSIPLQRIAEPVDVAHAVAFLADPAAGYITGVNLPVDGGYTAQ